MSSKISCQSLRLSIQWAMTSGRELFIKELSEIEAETAICTDILESCGGTNG